MQIDDYLDRAKDRNSIQSDRKLSDALGHSQTAITQWRTRRAWPTDKVMVKLSKLAGIDPAEGLLDLNIWRSDGEAVSIYSRMKKAMHAAVVILVVSIVGQLTIPAKQALAAFPAAHSTGHTIYIMENIVLPNNEYRPNEKMAHSQLTDTILLQIHFSRL